MGTRQTPPSTEAMAGYLTAAQIAELLQVSEKSVYRWAASDPTFPMLKIGGTVRFPRERLLRWLRDHEQRLGKPRMKQPVLAGAEPAAGTVTDRSQAFAATSLAKDARSGLVGARSRFSARLHAETKGALGGGTQP